MIIAAMLVLFMTVGASGVQVSADGNDTGNTPLRADQDAVKIYENAGYKLSVPAEIDELLIVEMSQNDGILFTVSEKLSVETDKAQGGSGDGAGRLFSIGALSEIQLYDMLCSDMSGLKSLPEMTPGSIMRITIPQMSVSCGRTMKTGNLWHSGVCSTSGPGVK